MSNEVPISDVVINAIQPPTPGNKRKLDTIGSTEGVEPAKQIPRSESLTSTPHINPAELHHVPLNNDNTPIISGMAPAASTATTNANGDSVINISDDGSNEQQVEGEQAPATTSTGGVANMMLNGFDRVLDAAQFPVDRIKDAGVYIGEGVVKVVEEVYDTMKDGLATAKEGASVVGDALAEVAVQTNLALKENFGKAVAAGEFAIEQAEHKVEHLTQVVTGHATPSISSTTSTSTTTETANLSHTNTTLVPDQGINAGPETTKTPGLSTSSTTSQDAASQWHTEAEKHQNVV